MMTIYLRYSNNPKFWDRKAFANSVDLDQTSQNMVSDQSSLFAIHTRVVPVNRGLGLL